MIVAANAQMLFHYWKIGNYILLSPAKINGWGSKIIKQLAKGHPTALHWKERLIERNLYLYVPVCKSMSFKSVAKFHRNRCKPVCPNHTECDQWSIKTEWQAIYAGTLLRQIQSIDCQLLAITQEVPAQFEDVEKPCLPFTGWESGNRRSFWPLL